MKIITMIAEKGGASKTTLARHLAVAAYREGHLVACIDTDGMGGLRQWGERRGRDPVVIAEAGTKTAHLDQAVEKLRAAGAAYCIIDTAGHFSAVALHAARIADLVIVPCRPTPDDLDAVWQTVGELRRYEVPYSVVVSCAPTNTKRPETDAVALLTSQDVAVAPVVVHEKRAVPMSGLTGETVFEMQDLSAAERKSVDEFQELWTWAASKLVKQPALA